MLESPRRIDKPWGYELIWAETDEYVGKILHVLAGEALSLQYHKVKDETFFLLEGQLLLQVGLSIDDIIEYRMLEGQSFHMRSQTIHRMIAETDCDILEVSTPHLDDIVRLEDRYGRITPTPAKS